MKVRLERGRPYGYIAPEELAAVCEMLDNISSQFDTLMGVVDGRVTTSTMDKWHKIHRKLKILAEVMRDYRHHIALGPG